MIVNRREVPIGVLERVLERMGEPFSCADLIASAREAWPQVDYETQMRLADRLIQRESKAMRIKKNGRLWAPAGDP